MIKLVRSQMIDLIPLIAILFMVLGGISKKPWLFFTGLAGKLRKKNQNKEMVELESYVKVRKLKEEIKNRSRKEGRISKGKKGEYGKVVRIENNIIKIKPLGKSFEKWYWKDELQEVSDLEYWMEKAVRGCLE